MFLRHFSSLHNNNCLTKLLLEKSIALYSTLVTGRRNLAKISDSKSVKTISTSSLYNAMADSSSNPCLKSEPDQEMESISCPDNLKEGVESVSEVTKTISETCLSMPGVDQNSDSITEEDALICSKVSASDETELPPVELSHEEKARQLSKIQIKKDKSEFKKRTAERDTADTHYDSAALIVESMFHFDQFLLSKRLEVALVNVKQEAEIKVETVDVEVQCAENWGLSIFVYDVQQSESVADVSENDPEQVKVGDNDGTVQPAGDKRKATEDPENKELKRAKLETKALKAKRPGFTDERYNETSYYIENGLRKVYPYYFTFTTFTKGRWVGEKILDVFAREFRAHPAEEYERCIRSGSLTVNYERVDVDYKLKHNDLLANIVHRHEVPVTADPISIVHMDEDVVVVNKPASIPVHPCGRYRHNTVVFILAKEYNLKNLRTIHRLDRLTSGLLMFGRTPKKARTMEQQIRNRQVQKEYVCRVEGQFPSETVECDQPIEVVSYKIGVCKVSDKGKTCSTTFKLLGYHAPTNTSVVLCLPHSGRMHQIRVHLQFLGYPVVNDPLYNHEVFGPLKGRGGLIGKTDTELVRDLIRIHNAENWLGVDADLSMLDEDLGSPNNKCISREPSPCEVLPSSPPRLSTSSIPLFPSNNNNICSISKRKVTVATQTGHEAPDLSFDGEKLTSDPHCYECKVRYRDPKPQDLVMFLHAWKYRGPGWAYQTELPDWARIDWTESVD